MLRVDSFEDFAVEVVEDSTEDVIVLGEFLCCA